MNILLQASHADCFTVAVVARDTTSSAFLSLRCGPNLSIHFPGVGTENVTAARDLAAKLATAADELEQLLTPTSEAV